MSTVQPQGRAKRYFYVGETIRLEPATGAHIENSSWSDWFNSQRTSQYTRHGLYPNTVEDQRKFLDDVVASGRFVLLITTHDSDEPVGVISLSGVDFRQRSAMIAIVMDTESEVDVPPLASLEAMSFVTQHAFEVMGLNRIEAGQAYPALRKWARLLELLGYRAEGFKREAFRRGQATSDVVMLSCLYEDYAAIAAGRNGALWPGRAEAMRLIAQLPKVSFAERLEQSSQSLADEYFGG